MKKKSLLLFLVVSWVFVGSTNGQENKFHAVINERGVQELSIIGDSYYFSPVHIIVKANIPVEIKVKKKSEGIVPHNIVVKAPEAGINFSESVKIKPTIIKFTPTQTGKYIFYCDKKLFFFKSHREKGMEGIIEVIQ